MHPNGGGAVIGVKRPVAPCPHDIAQWRAAGTLEHKLRCCRCQTTLDTEFGNVPRTLGVVLFRDVRDNSYAPYQPAWNR